MEEDGILIDLFWRNNWFENPAIWLADWHLKIKDTEYDVGLTKNYCITICITISVQKISSLHKFILKIQQILGPQELKSHDHFWPCPPKKRWINFLFYWICTSMQKIGLFYLFIFDIQSFLESCDQNSHTHLWPC